MASRLEEMLSKGKSVSLVDWVSFAFAEMAAIYGAKLATQWPMGLTEAKRKFIEALAGYRPSEVARGIKALEQTKWPPTLPEFLALCRTEIDYEQAFNEASRQMALRSTGRDTWSHPAVYWAAIRYGYTEVQQHPWVIAKGRWTSLLSQALVENLSMPTGEEKGRKQLDAPGKSLTDADTARARLAEVRAMIRRVPRSSRPVQ